jgi:predicted SnoaL-like aldol condensation-catalyzing enzyme
MQAQDNKAPKAVVQQFWNKIFDQGNYDEADHILTPDWHLHQSEWTGGDRDLDGLKTMVEKFRARYPTLRTQINEQEQATAEGNRVVTRFTVTGTHAETGNQVKVEGMSISVFSGEKIKETWVNWDAFGLLAQEDPIDWPKCWWC